MTKGSMSEPTRFAEATSWAKAVITSYTALSVYLDRNSGEKNMKLDRVLESE